MEQRRHQHREPLRQSAQQRQKKTACRSACHALAAQGQDPRIHRQKAQKKPVPAFDLGAERFGKGHELFPQQDPAAPCTDEVQQRFIRMTAQQQCDDSTQHQKGQNCRIPACSGMQDRGQGLRQKTAQSLPGVFCKRRRRYRALFQIGAPRLRARKAHIPVVHPVILPIRCKISSSSGHAAASTRQRPASPTHHASDSAPASSQRVWV